MEMFGRLCRGPGSDGRLVRVKQTWRYSFEPSGECAVLGKFLQNTYRCASSMIKCMNPQAKLLCTVYSYDIKRTERSSSPEISLSMQKHCLL